MAFVVPDRAIRGSAQFAGLRPGRDTALVITAAIGSLLLTTAEAQPLIPREPQYVYTLTGSPHIAPMGGGWEAVFVGLPVAACLLAVFRGWPGIRRSAGILVAAIGIAAFLVNVLTVNSGISVLDILTQRFQWPFSAPLLAAVYFSAAATVWLAFARDARDKRFASGILLAAGAFGYLAYLQQLELYVTFVPSGDLAPGRAVFAGMFGGAVVLTAGVLAQAVYSSAGDQAGLHGMTPYPATPQGGRLAVPPPQAVWYDPVRIAKLLAVTAALTITIAAVYQAVFATKAYTHGSAQSSTLLTGAGIFILLGVFPALLALAACLTVFGQRDPDRHLATGVLLAGCLLALVYFGAAHIFGWMVPVHQYGGWLISSSDLGTAGALVLGVAGIALGIAPDDAGFPVEAVTPAGPPPEPVPPAGGAQPEMTRYLCTAPHLDDGYARRVIEEVVADPHRAVVPSLGIDMGIVVRHCFAARRRQNVRDGLLTMIILATIPLILFHHSLAGLRDILVCLLLAGAVAFTDRWIGRYLVTRRLTRERFDPAAGPWLSNAEQAKLTDALAAQQGDISVYGTYNPFVGSGFARGGWSFAVNVARGKLPTAGEVRREPLPFEVDEFYAAVERDITALDLAGLTVENRLLVDGQKIRDDARFLPNREGRPATEIGADTLLAMSRDPELQNRTYQCIRLQAWEGDLVLSVFVNFTKLGTALLAEVQHYLLAPLQPEYRQADKLGTWTLGYRLRTELTSAPFAVAGTAIKAPFRLGRLLVRTGLHWRTERVAMRRIKADPEYNFGAMTSVRELAQSRHYRRYFQQVDRDLNTKLIDRQVLDTITEFLDTHNVDISQFEEQRTTILNNGLLVSGGEFKAGSVAVGPQAKSVVTQFSQGVQTLLRPGGEGK